MPAMVAGSALSRLLAQVSLGLGQLELQQGQVGVGAVDAREQELVRPPLQGPQQMAHTAVEDGGGNSRSVVTCGSAIVSASSA